MDPVHRGRICDKAPARTAWLDQRAACDPSQSIARVAAVDRDRIVLLDRVGPFHAKLAGSLLHHHRFSHELPCVGDWVCTERRPDDDFGVVHAVLERRTALRRKSAGDTADAQMIAANLDTVMIVQSCHVDFDLKRLERYLVMVMDGGAHPCILLTKTDLVSPEVLAEQLSEIGAMALMILESFGPTGALAQQSVAIVPSYQEAPARIS